MLANIQWTGPQPLVPGIVSSMVTSRKIVPSAHHVEAGLSEGP